MSIETRLNAINDHLVDDYSVLTLAGADLTNVDKNIVNLKPTWKERLLYFINNGTDIVWDNWEKVVGEGTELTLSNTEQAPMKVLLKGNTYQDSTTGKNLFSGNYSQFDSTGGEGTTYGYFKLPDDGEIYTLSVIAKNNFTATLSQYIGFTKNGGTATGGFVWLIQGNQTYTKGQKYTIYNSTQGTRLDYVSIYSNNSTTLEQLVNNFYIQLEKGSSATEYEPYTNGPSPNPDYPQEVHTVSGDNIIVSTGKNILDFDAFLNYSNVIYTKNGGTYNITDRGNIITNRYPLNLLPNTTYTLSCEKTTNNVSALRLQIYEGGTYLTRVLATGSSEKSATFTTNNSSNYYMNMTFSGDISYPLVWKNVMLEKGANATTYQEYQGSQTYPINLPEGMFLGSIGDYKDRFFKTIEGDSVYDSLDSATKQTLDSNEWYLEKNIGKVVLNGTENWGLQSATAGQFGLNNSTVTNNTGYCDNFIVKTSYVTTGKPYFRLANAVFFAEIGTEFLSEVTVSAWTTWLSTHNTEVYYVLATPTYTKIEGTLASQLEEVYNAVSYEGQTNIGQTNDDLPFVLDVSALSQEV